MIDTPEGPLNPPGRLAATRQWLNQAPNSLLVLVILAQLALIWGFTYFPSTDGATHLASAAVMRQYNAPDATAWRQYYELPHRLDPNLAGHLVLAGLMYIAPALIAEKLLLAAYIILLPVAFGYCLRAIRKDAGVMTLLVTPFTFTYVLHMGFYNFSMSIVVYFWVFGYWLKHRRDWRAVRVVTLGLLMLVLYMSHLLSLILAVASIGVVIVWEAAYQWWTDRRNGAAWRKWIVGAALTAIAALPALALAALFMRRHTDPKLIYSTKLQMLKSLFSLESLESFRGAELWLTQALSAVLVLAALFVVVRRIRQRRIEWSDGLLLVVCAFGVLYLKAGEQVYLPMRLGLYVFLGLILWLGVQTYHRWAKWALLGTSAAVALGMLGMYLPMYWRLNEQLTEYMSVAPYIQPNSTLLAMAEIRKDDAMQSVGARLGWAPGGSINHGIHAFLYAQGYLVPRLRLVDLRNYEADMGYFPVDFRSPLNPYKKLAVPYPSPPRGFPKSPSGLEWWPPSIDIPAYEAAGGKVDYILLWGKMDEMRADPQSKAFFAQLGRLYDPVYTSEPLGLAHLYRRRELP